MLKVNEPEKAVSSKSNRKVLYQWHTWIGFHLAAIIFVILASGTIATISNEIDWLVQHDMRVVPDGEMVSHQQMVDAISKEAPTHFLSSLSRMEGDHFAYRATMFDEFGRRYFMHVNQWTGDVTGTTGVITVQRIFRDLHRYLFMPSVIGLPLVTSFAFLLSISLYTGLKTSRNWKTLATRIRFNKGARIAVGDAHKAFGLWAIWFFVLMIITSVWYLVEFGANVSGQRFELERPKLTVERQAKFDLHIKDASTQEIINTVSEHFPELRIATIFYPRTPQSPVRVTGYDQNPLLRERANQIMLDPESLEVIHIHRENKIGWVAYLNEMADPLHFGNFGGLPTKLIWFIFGIGMTGLSVSGVWLTWKRVKDSALSRTQVATFPVLLLSIISCYFWLDHFQGQKIPKNLTALQPLTIHGLLVTPYINKRADGYVERIHISILGKQGRPAISKLEFVSEDSKRSKEFKINSFGKNVLGVARLSEGELMNQEALQLRSC